MTTATKTAKDLQEFSGKAPAEVRMAGKILCILEDPPNLGDEVTLLVKLRVIDVGVVEHEGGEHVFYRKTKLLGAWKPGTTPPIDTNQASLWDQAPPEGTFEESADEGDEIVAAREEAKAARAKSKEPE